MEESVGGYGEKNRRAIFSSVLLGVIVTNGKGG